MAARRKSASVPLAEKVYEQIKRDIFDFRLLPGDRFSESNVAARLNISRTPVREALHKLEKEGYIQVAPRSGWNVRPFDFDYFENLYDVRLILELAAVERLCSLAEPPDLRELKETWLVPPARRLRDMKRVAELDERFHETLVAATGNPEMTRLHRDVTERIRIIRRLDFTQPRRIDATYDEHAQILRHILGRRRAQAEILLRAHIETSKNEVRKITLHMLHQARAALADRSVGGNGRRRPRT
ncbi:MAG TPA: GntR family transcriptional regulator [Burkholderiales bacterium]